MQTNQLADMLGVRPASVTGMLQKLAAAEPALVEYHKHQGVRLSAAGQAEALTIVRRHRLVELYLHEKLGYSWDEVHEEADRLEHVVNDAFIDRLAEVLDDPAKDPHGHAIPRPDLTLEPVKVMPLTHLAPHTAARVSHVRDDDPAVLRSLADIGLLPGVVVSVLGEDNPADQMVLAIGERQDPMKIQTTLARHVFVRADSR